VSDPRLDALAETARNRGLKLVRSRVRTPGKRRFGKAGLTDASGKPVFGMDAKGPTATPDAVEDYLRRLEAQDWGASLSAPERPRRKPKPQAANDQAPLARATAASPPAPPAKPAKPKPAKPKPPPPSPKIREAKPSDAARLAELIRELGHDIDEKQVRKNLAALKKTGELPLVATLGKQIVGMCGVGKRIVIARPAPLGRITALIVTREAQGRGIGRMLVDAAEAWMRKAGCQLAELTSNDRRAEAHAFYRHLGYERTSIRFAKTL
jgi:GNAT superfamily N-acetyltransferase